MKFKKIFIIETKEPYPFNVSVTNNGGSVYFTDEAGFDWAKNQSRPITFSQLPKPLLKQIK